MIYTSDNAEMPAISLNVSRFYRLRNNKTTKISVRLIFSFKRMISTKTVITFARGFAVKEVIRAEKRTRR